jgi:hypothetical protein
MRMVDWTRRHLFVAALIVMPLGLDAHLAAAAWPQSGRVLSGAPSPQGDAHAAPDGAGGAIVTWTNGATGAVDLFAQHVLASGELDPAWPAAGRALLLDPAALNKPVGTQAHPVIVSDGAGGAIVAWQDGRDNPPTAGVFAQHVLANGQVDARWPANGAALCAIPGPRNALAIASDGAGGAIVTWMDGRSGATGLDIFAQHVLVSGVVDPRWPVDGAPVCVVTGRQAEPKIDTDGEGGALITWFDPRSTVSGFDIFVQHMLASGIADPAWPANGLGLCTAPGAQIQPAIVSDRAHGAIVAWDDNRNVDPNIFAHHVLASGVPDPAWPVNGLGLAIVLNDQEHAIIVSDGGTGAIVAWEDQRTPVHNMYAQHVRITGSVDPTWPATGLALSTRPTEQTAGVIVADGRGGAIVAWQDIDQTTGQTARVDIFAQHVLAPGVLDTAFPAAGLPIATLPTLETTPSIVAAGEETPGGPSGAIVTWTGISTDTTANIFALQFTTLIETTDVDDPGQARIRFAQPSPNPARVSLALRFTLPRAAGIELAIFDAAGRRVRTLASGDHASGAHAIAWDLRDERGRAVGAGLYLARLDADGVRLTQKFVTVP